MFKCLYPDMYIESIFALDPEELKKKGIEGIICDLDNTVVRWDEAEPRPDAIKWLQMMKRQGFKMCIVSNTLTERAGRVSDLLSIPAIPGAVKPSRRAFVRALQYLETEPHNTAVIGDQMFTDVLGGNRVGMYTILVVPMSRNEFFITRIVRRIERFVLRRLVRRGVIKDLS
jgi:HAD superfamily phosphatase (TIGR01668 family)